VTQYTISSCGRPFGASWRHRPLQVACHASGRTISPNCSTACPAGVRERRAPLPGATVGCRELSCRDQLLSMVFAQVTGRASLRRDGERVGRLGSPSLSLWLRGGGGPQHLGRGQRATRLPDLRGHRPGHDRPAPAGAAPGSRVGPTGRRRLRPRLDHHRPVPEAVSLGRFRRRKAGVKATPAGPADRHPGIPAVSPAKTHDLWMLDQLPSRPGPSTSSTRATTTSPASTASTPRGVLRHPGQIQPGLWRARTPAGGPRRSRCAGTGSSACAAPSRGSATPTPCAAVSYVDPQTDKRLTFLTNHLTLGALLVALLYHKRWRIELFFSGSSSTCASRRSSGSAPTRSRANSGSRSSRTCWSCGSDIATTTQPCTKSTAFSA